VRWGSRDLALRLPSRSVGIVVDVCFVPAPALLYCHTGTAHNPEKPLAGTAVEGTQETAWQNVREVTGELEEIQASSGSLRIAELAWSKFASWLEVVGYDHCIGLVEEQTEVVRMTADFVVHSVRMLSYLYAVVDQ
jgi:hypothetical protein